MFMMFWLTQPLMFNFFDRILGDSETTFCTYTWILTIWIGRSKPGLVPSVTSMISRKIVDQGYQKFRCKLYNYDKYFSNLKGFWTTRKSLGAILKWKWDHSKPYFFGCGHFHLQRASLYKTYDVMKRKFSIFECHLLFVETPKAFWLKKLDKTTNNTLFELASDAKWPEVNVLTL